MKHYPKILPEVLDTLARQMWPKNESFDDYLNEKWAEMVTERFDLEWIRHSHGVPSTYRSGCRGPLCSIANRRMAREQRERSGSEVRVKNHILLGEQAIDILDVFLVRRMEQMRETNIKEMIYIGG